MTTDTSHQYPLYIRFGGLPEGGRSWFHPAMPYREAGVSVFRAEKTTGIDYVRGPIRTRYVADVSSSPELAAFFFALADRPVYQVWGSEVGVGHAGEPLLAGPDLRCEPLSPAAKVISSGHYDEDIAATLHRLRAGLALFGLGSFF